MDRFYFIDTNLILGYCNFLDKFHNLSKDLLDPLNQMYSKFIYLLYTVEMEFNKKIQFEINEFMQKINNYLTNNISNITEIKQTWGKLNNFEKYIFNLLEQEKLVEVCHSDILKISSKYLHKLRKSFDTLTKEWIKRPRVEEYSLILRTKVYLAYYNKISRLIHYPDSLHITLAVHETIKKDPKATLHKFIFYTADTEWSRINSIIEISNFRIKIVFTKDIIIGHKSILKYVLTTYNYLQEGYSCIILGRGRNINAAVFTYNDLKNTLCPTLKYNKIILGTEIYKNRKWSYIEIHISLF